MSALDSTATSMSLKFFSKLYKCCIQLGTLLVVTGTSAMHLITEHELKEVIVHRIPDTPCANGYVETIDMLPV